MNLPKITIVTPVYNRVEFIEETILSVLNQGYPNLEYIIIDGGSTDGTVEVIKKYEKSLTCWMSEPDKGMYDALRKGFEQSKGTIMAWLNSDDKHHAQCLENVARIFSDVPDLEWIVGAPSMYNERGMCVQVSPERSWSFDKLAAGDYRWIQQESVFWQRSLWEKAGSKISTDYKYAGDFELWCRFFKHAKLYSVATLLSGFRLHGRQLSVNNDLVYEQEVQQILQWYALQNKSGLLKISTRLKHALRGLIHRSLKYIVKRTKGRINRLLRIPSVITYDFETGKWKK